MDIPPEHIESLNKNIEQYEQKARRRAWLLTIIPLLIGGVLLGYTIWQVQYYEQLRGDAERRLKETSEKLDTTIANLQGTQVQLNQADTDLGAVQKQLAQITKDLEQTKEDLEKTKEELEEATQKLESANVFVSHSYPIRPEDIKGSSLDRFEQEEEVLFYILDLQQEKPTWNRNGFSVEDGFNSPSFAVHVLQYFGLIPSDYSADAKPWEILELEPVDSPSIGDIVYYPNGYTMFYYELDGESFVIGMTPLGIISQELDFADNPRYLDVPY